MSIVGGTALLQELALPGSISDAVDRDYALGLTAVIEQFDPPAVSTALIALAAFLLFTWLITSLDSATLVIGHLLDVPETTPSKVFWGGTLAAVTCALLGVGGVPALQAASIVIGLPLGFLTIALGAGLLRELLRGRL
jgi:choline/glycine/proline betaine transport protein